MKVAMIHLTSIFLFLNQNFLPTVTLFGVKGNKNAILRSQSDEESSSRQRVRFSSVGSNVSPLN